MFPRTPNCIHLYTIFLIILSVYTTPVTAEVGDVLIRGASKSLTIGSSWELEEGYTITFKDIDRQGENALIELTKNNVKVSGDIMGEGDQFDYKKDIDGKEYTIISVKLTNMHSGSVELGYANQYSEGSYDAESTEQVKSSENIVKLITPSDGTVMDNGRTDRQDSIVWDFDWSDIESASEYQIYVKGKNTENPIIDKITTSSSYHHDNFGSYIVDRNKFWTWKVRAKVDGQWYDWSEPRTFNVEQANTDSRTSKQASTNSPTTEKSQLPIVNTNSATSISSNGAILQGTVNPNGLSTVVSFRAGNSNTQSHFTSTPVQYVGSGTSYRSVNYRLTGLSPSTTYSYYVSATNSAGAQNGGVVTFTTPRSATATYNPPSYQAPAKQTNKGSPFWDFILIIVGLIGSAIIYNIDLKT